MTAARGADRPARPNSPPTARAARRRVATALALYRRRGEGPDVRDRVLTVYAAVLAAALLATGAVRGVVLWLDQPVVLDVLDPARAGGPVLLALDALLVASVLAGRVHGPASRRTWMLAAFAASPVPLAAALRRPLTVTASIGALLAAGVAVAPAAVLAAHGSLSPAEVVTAAVVAAAGGVVTVTVWLWSQTATRLASAAAAVGLVAAAAIGWATLGDRAVALTLAPPIVLPGAVLVAALSWATTGRLLNSIHPAAALAQSQRLGLVRMLSATGDIAGGLAQLHRPPSTGRHLRAAPVLRGALAVLVMDLVALLRTPSRLAWSMVATIGAGALLAGGAATGAVADAAAGTLVVYVASASWSAGLHHAADAAGRPALYGTRTSLLVLRHGLAPLVVALVGLALGAAWALVGIGPTAGHGGAIGAVIVSAAALTALVRAYDALRGPLPIVLLMPVPTPMGDLSILGVLMWQADALIIATAVPALVVALLATPALSAVCGVVAAVIVAALTARRLGRLQTA